MMDEFAAQLRTMIGGMSDTELAGMQQLVHNMLQTVLEEVQRRATDKKSPQNTGPSPRTVHTLDDVVADTSHANAILVTALSNEELDVYKQQVCELFETIRAEIQRRPALVAAAMQAAPTLQ